MISSHFAKLGVIMHRTQSAKRFLMYRWIIMNGFDYLPFYSKFKKLLHLIFCFSDLYQKNCFLICCMYASWSWQSCVQIVYILWTNLAYSYLSLVCNPGRGRLLGLVRMRTLLDDQQRSKWHVGHKLAHKDFYIAVRRKPKPLDILHWSYILVDNSVEHR